MGARVSKSAHNKTAEFPISSDKNSSAVTSVGSDNSHYYYSNNNTERLVSAPIEAAQQAKAACSVAVAVSSLVAAPINVQVEESPSLSYAQLGNVSSSSVTSVNSNNCAKQIIIKIQYTKMENGQQHEEVAEEQAAASSKGHGQANEWEEREQALDALASSKAQFENLIPHDCRRSLGSVNNVPALESNGLLETATTSRTAGSSVATTPLAVVSASASYNSLSSQSGIESVEYCEVLEDVAAAEPPTAAGGAIPKKKERKNAERPAKRQGAFRSALSRLLEPSSSKLNKHKHDRKSGKHSKHNEQNTAQLRAPTATAAAAPQLSCYRNSMPLRPAGSCQAHANRPVTFSGAPPRTVNTGGSSSGQATRNSQNNANGNQFLWASINAPSRVVVIQPNFASVVTLGHIQDNIMRWMTTEMSGVAVGVADGSTTVAGANNAATTLLATNGPIVHSQVDFVHSLVPDLEKIINTSYYWGKIDRYEAERLLEGKPEGTFLLRDSAQDEYLFSVTFRKYGRSLHARIEHGGGKFSFDRHDPGVFTAPTVTGLLDHYKDPDSVMFFEPMLTVPLHRKTTFSLQELCRATIVSHTTYDGVNQLELPGSLKSYLKEYHLKQKLRVKPFDLF